MLEEGRTAEEYVGRSAPGGLPTFFWARFYALKSYYYVIGCRRVALWAISKVAVNLIRRPWRLYVYN